MEEVADQWARKEIGKIYGLIREGLSELKTTLIGIDGTNGVRGDLRKLEARVDMQEEDSQALRQDLRHYLDIERENTCLGVRAVAEHIEESKKMAEEDAKLKVAQVGASATVEVARITSKGAVAREWLTLLGVLASIILGVLK